MPLLIRALAALVLALPALASAHEVYVLPAHTAAEALETPSFSELAVIRDNMDLFMYWAFVAIVVVFVVFFASISERLERFFDPFLSKLRRYAAPVARVTIGLSFLAAAFSQATYGPELPLASTYGSFSPVVTAVLIALGILITFGVYVRAAAIIALAMFFVGICFHGAYLLTYTNYLGEILVLLILGAHHGASPRAARESALAKRFAPYSFFILRVSFGISLLYASLYAKVLHNNLALEVAYAYPSLVHFFGFEPHFLVLGAAIIEIVVAVFFIVGFEIRFTSLFLLFWLSLSLWYFGEVVWPHIVLIGIPLAFVFYGYDKYSLEGRFFKSGAREPVL